MILVVDDHHDTAQFLCRLLGKKGYPTHCAKDAFEALTFLRSQMPRLIILDLQMPGMTGLEMLDVIRHDAQLRRIPVLIYSAAHQKSQADLALRLGAKAFMIKGVIGIPALLELVEQYAMPADV